MSIAVRKPLVPAPGAPGAAETVEAGRRLNIDVVFTSVEATRAALKKAGDLAARLGASITLVAVEAVPFPAPLENPLVRVDWNERRLRAIAEESPVETKVQVYLCRDRLRALAAALGPHSVIVIGGRKRWWPSWESRLARGLRRAGHEVIFTEAR
jgi:hypothetical protein